MLAFVSLKPEVFPLDPKTVLKCANVKCEKAFLFCEAVIWHWNDSKTNNAGFCHNTCALDAMNHDAMGRA